MDFTLDETQQAVADLAATVLRDEPTRPRPAGARPAPSGYDETLWKAMAQAGLLALAVPAELGGDGFGRGRGRGGRSPRSAGRACRCRRWPRSSLGVLPVSRARHRADSNGGCCPRSPTGACSPAPSRAPVTRSRPRSVLLSGTARAACRTPQQAHRMLLPTGAGLYLVDPARRRGQLRPHAHLDRGARVHRRPCAERAGAADCSAPTSGRLERFALAGAAAVADGVHRRGAAADRGAPRARATSSAGRWPRSRPSRSRSPTSTSRPAPSTWPPRRRAGGWPTGRDADADLDVAGVLARRRAAAGAADLPSPARRARRRHHLPAAPLLLARQGPGPLRRRRRPTASTGSERGVPRTDRRAAGPAGELREYFAGSCHADEAQALLTDRHGEIYRDVVRRMGRDGWLGVGWPAEYGGRGFGEIEQQIFVNEAARARRARCPT